MEFSEAIVVGVIQGVTEWLPISSEGMISLVMLNIFSRPLHEAIPISIWLHTGTLLAAILYFRREIEEILRNFTAYLENIRADTEVNSITNFLIVSTFLTGIVGLPLFLFSLDKLDIPGEVATALIGLLLILTGVSQRYTKGRIGQRRKATITDGVLVGGVQAFSVFPGLSRSGLTVSALLFRGYTGRRALKLSFLMSIPAILGAEVGMVFLKSFRLDFPMMIAMLTSFVFGYLTIKTLMGVAEKVNFGGFCIFIGLLSFVPLLV
jgi:undecaprenyl-diphosphatase